MTVVGTFLINSVMAFYLEEFSKLGCRLLEELLRGEAGVRGVLGFPQQCLVLSKNAQGHLGAANIHARIDLHVPRRPFCCGFYP